MDEALTFSAEMVLLVTSLVGGSFTLYILKQNLQEFKKRKAQLRVLEEAASNSKKDRSGGIINVREKIDNKRELILINGYAF